MSYQVLARKWRPQDFKDMVGQDHISSTLCNAIKNDRVGHAYLFVGTRGTGKTTTARIFAKAINCESPLPDANPCNKCTNCTEITAGSSMDVLEIDGASNNGVDDIRRLRDNVQYTPARCKYKVYIIDEVHMLSTAAWNALLKTLEEPPEHVKFFFATTEVHKVLPTILSRCQRFDLKRITQGTIARRLQEIAQAENAKFDMSALNSIARAANGGMRDGLSIMDQMIAFCSEQDVITENDVSEVFGLTSSHDLGKIISAMLTDNAAELINQINRLSDMGRNLEQLYSDLLHFCRNLMICAISGNNATDILDLDEYDLGMAQSIVSQSSPDTIQKLMDGFLNYDGKLRNTLNKRVFMEMTLVRIMKDAHAVSLNDILARINHLRKTGSLDTLEGEMPTTAKTIELPEPQKKNDIIPVIAESKESAPKETPEIEEKEPEVYQEEKVEESAPALEAEPIETATEAPLSEIAPTNEEETAPENIIQEIPKPEPVPESKTEPKPLPEAEESSFLAHVQDQIETVSLVPEKAEEPKKEEAPPIEDYSEEEMEAPHFETVQMVSPRYDIRSRLNRNKIETREIDDSFDLPYSTLLDLENIENARQQDALNLGFKKFQGNFDESSETPGAQLGVFHTITQSAENPQTAQAEPEIKRQEQVAPEKEEIQEQAPVESAVKTEEEPVPSATEEVKEPEQEYVPEQFTPQSAEQPADTLEEIKTQTAETEAEASPESIAADFWNSLVNNIQSTQLKTVVQKLSPVSYQDNRFYVAYETGSIELEESAKQLLESELKKLTNAPALELMLMGASQDVEDDKPVLTSGEDVWNRVKSNPLFDNICREFDGKIIDVRG